MHTRLVCVFALIVACDGGSDGGGGAGGTGQVARDKTTLVSAVVRMRDAQCAYYARCAASTPGAQRYIDGCNVSKALPDTLAALFLLEEDDVVSRGAYDAAQGDKCLAAIASAACSDGATLREACNSVFVGTLAVGQCCEGDDACVPTAYCDWSASVGDSGYGVCKARPANGQQCTNDVPCQQGAYCNGSTCEALVPAGGACGDAPTFGDSPCGPVAECVAGICTRLTFASTGEACAEAAGRRCLGDLDCISGTCQPFEGAGIGESCAGQECSAGLYCDDGSDGSLSCTEAATLGDPCGPGSDDELFVCDPASNTLRFGRIGDACEADSQCIVGGGYCEGDKCVAQVPQAAACERDTMCAGLLCDEGKCGDIFNKPISTSCQPSEQGGAGVGAP
jgi:hypothetical protein